MNLSRRDVLLTSTVFGLGALVPARRVLAEQPGDPGSFPRQDLDSVREVVGASHGNFDRVKELVTRRPALAKATWDWGFGDWESALGAASHVGRADIAQFLIEHGARIDIFAAAMLGQLEVVKALVAATPGVQRTLGPHGISLLAHAKAGKQNAVADYLESLGDAGRSQQSAPLSDAQLKACVGAYRSESGVRFEIQEKAGQLQIAPEGGAVRPLFHIGDAVFFPTGAAAVRIAFTIESGVARGATISDGDSVLAATRSN